jgi:hypothetical protein
MNPRRSSLAILLVIVISVGGCDLGGAPTGDVQYARIYFKYDFRDTVNTFSGTLTKDLVAGGTVTVPFWLTTEEQDSILAEAVRRQFYDLPDTIRGMPGIYQTPDPGPQTLCIDVNGRSHQVVWYSTSSNEHIVRLSQFIRDLVQATSEYKSLPPAQGGYL